MNPVIVHLFTQQNEVQNFFENKHDLNAKSWHGWVIRS